MTLPEFLTQTADGEILLTGHRIDLFHVVHYYNEGYSPEMLATQYPSLSLALIHKVIAFYLENRQEVDEYVSRYRADLEQQRAAGKHLDVASLRQRLEV
ncbi:MAG: DUF433 domain-containing protein [Planctomycetaceae bacterium]